ncbi:DUF6924 domain-containing protein [Catellatospora coxensis]
MLALLGDETPLTVVFVADKVTMVDPERPLLAVATLDSDPEYAQEVTEFGREFRILPRESHGLHVNLELGNMDFTDWSRSAAAAPDRTFRGFGGTG